MLRLTAALTRLAAWLETFDTRGLPRHLATIPPTPDEDEGAAAREPFSVRVSGANGQYIGVDERDGRGVQWFQCWGEKQLL